MSRMQTPMTPIAEGMPAPDFMAVDHEGKMHSLGDYAGEWLLLYFYPKDDTPGCTKEACGFRDAYADLKQYVHILGVSADSAESHKKFAEKYHLTFPLLADPERSIIESYGANGVLFTKRTSFLIDPAGKIAKIYTSVKPEEHAPEVLADIQALRK